LAKELAETREQGAKPPDYRSRRLLILAERARFARSERNGSGIASTFWKLPPWLVVLGTGMAGGLMAALS
jgi:hypothetical protein